MKGERPKQPHYAVIWDASQAVGRPEVTDLIEDVLTGLRTEERMFPDLHAHKVTEALIKAGYLDKVQVLTTATPVAIPHLDDILAAAERAGKTAVVTANCPQYESIERFDMGSMKVRLFDSDDDAKDWANLNPHYITEVVSVTTE